ncbi:hypothetical protein AB0A69_16180 [Streptomyces sp. NPDC045431]|uniref:hypothetical protein n=1 Tax=Streptomyces sp. NPDC045431 TaxID=3155613 RepID=UPI0033D1BCD2
MTASLLREQRQQPLPRAYRAAAWTALAWAGVLLVWAAYNCFWQVGPAEFLQGVFYYGFNDGSGRAETFNLNWAVVYLAAGLLILKGNALGRGLAVGVALVEGYNRLRSLTGALLDDQQSDWFTGTLQGQLKLVTFAAGFLVTAALTVLLVRGREAHQPWQPPANPWTRQAQAAQQSAQQSVPHSVQQSAQAYPQQGPPPAAPQPYHPGPQAAPHTPQPYGNAVPPVPPGWPQQDARQGPPQGPPYGAPRPPQPPQG